MVEMSVLGISLQEESGAPVLLLHPHGTRKILPVAISPVEALTVSTALHGDANALRGRRRTDDSSKREERPAGLFPRPLTHDLLFAILDSLGGALASVELLAVGGGDYCRSCYCERRSRSA